MISMLRESTFLKKLIYLLPLLFICIASIAIVAPTMHYNINDPNLIPYFNGDEGYRMDVIWSYYSGEIRDSYKGGYDYGLLLLYFSDFSRIVLSHFMNFAPGTFVLIFRWIHLVFWIASLVMFWRFIKYHFGERWQSIIGVTVLASLPALPYFLSNLKPDAIVLFLMILGLDYTLRIVNKPSWRNLSLAIAMASLATLVKFSGVFLLPPLVFAMFLSEKYKKSEYFAFPHIKLAWLLYMFIGFIFISLPLLAVLFYVRGTTGCTMYEQYGLWRSFLQNKLIISLFLMGVCFIFISGILWWFNKSNKFVIVMEIVNKINSYTCIVFGLFLGFTLIFGFRWITAPKYFLVSYSQIAPLVTPYAFENNLNIVHKEGVLVSFFINIIDKVKDFDPIIFILFVFFYIPSETWSIRQNIKSDYLGLYKRLILFSFVFVFLVFIFITMTRAEQLHMLPFISAAIILVFQGIKLFSNSFKGDTWIKNGVLATVGILLFIDIINNGETVISLTTNKYRQHEDVGFEIAKWWRQNIQKEAIIVADHHRYVYIPSEYKNIKILRSYKSECLKIDPVDELRQLVADHQPQYIYYNLGSIGMPKDNQTWPPINEMLPNKKVRLVKTFESSGRKYQRLPDDKFVIYEIYDKEEW